MPRTLHALLYDYVPDLLERREPFRPGHLELLEELRRENLCVMAGAIGDPVYGGLLVFATREAAEDFVARDPYGPAGLVTRTRIEPWTVAVG